MRQSLCSNQPTSALMTVWVCLRSAAASCAIWPLVCSRMAILHCAGCDLTSVRFLLTASDLDSGLDVAMGVASTLCPVTLATACTDTLQLIDAATGLPKKSNVQATGKRWAVNTKAEDARAPEAESSHPHVRQ